MSYLKNQNKMPEFLCNYLKYKNFIAFCPTSTVETYYCNLKVFLKFIKLYFYDKEKLDYIDKTTLKNVEIQDITIDDMAKVTRNDIESYIYFLSNVLQNDSKTKNNKVSVLKKFFDYLANNNFISDNPTTNIDYARVKKRLPKYLNLKESKQMLSHSIKSNDKYKIRNYAIICLFLNCGMRLSELVNINISDIKLDERTIKITGKGNKQRILYLNNASKEVINKYMKVRQKTGYDNADSDALFLSSRNKRISRRNVESIITNKLTTLFAEKEGLHTHSLRHSCASMLYNENNVDVFILKRILGHESLSATEVYTHVDSKKMRYIMDNCTISSLLEKWY